MLNSDDISDAVVEKLLLIPALATAMTPPDLSPPRISAFYDLFGADRTLQMEIYEMPAPSILVHTLGPLPGPFNGSTMFKYHVQVHVKMANMAGVSNPVSYADLWQMICNSVPTGSTRNIRYLTILTGLDIMEPPSFARAVDEDHLDIMRGECVFPEIGDN